MTGTTGDPEAQTSSAQGWRPPAGKSAQTGALVREDGAQVLEVTEKHGTLYNSIPCMPLPVAILCCIFNIVVPGLGESLSCLCVSLSLSQ